MEIWRDIVGYEGSYEVSNCGLVRSWVSGNGLGKRSSPVLLSLHGMTGGYVAATLRGKSCLVHRLVLEAFQGPCPVGMEGCHKDGNSANNRLDNLRWDTPTNNHADKVAHGTDLHMALTFAARKTLPPV